MSPKTVLSACSNLPHVYISRMSFISSDDQQEVLSHIYNRCDFSDFYQKGSWVKFKHGLYANDIGYVAEVSHSDDLLVLTIPRINDDRCQKRKRRPFNRPPQCLMTSDRIQALCKTTSSFHDSLPYRKIDKYTFHSTGLLAVRVMGLHAISRANPIAADVVVYTSVGLDTTRISNREFLQVRDKVSVIAGQFTNSHGTVLQLNDDQALITISDDSLHSEISSMVDIANLKREFSVGTCVRVQLGPHAGFRGLIVTHDGNSLHLVDSHKEVDISCVL